MKKEVHQNRTDYILSSDYFDYVYSALHVQCYYSTDVECAERAYNALEEFHDDDGYILGCITYALKNKFEGIEYTYKLENLSHEQILQVIILLRFLLVYGYKIHDILHMPTGVQIAQAILAHKKLPPPPVRIPTDLNSILRTYSSLSSNAVSHIVSQEYIDEHCLLIKDIIKKTNTIEINPDHKDGMRAKTALIQAQKNSMQKIKKGVVTPQKQDTFSQKRRQSEVPPYRGYRSAWERVIGLILWELWSDTEEAFHQKNIPISKIWSLFEKTDIYNKMHKAAYSTEAMSEDYGYLSSLRAALEKDERSYRRWAEVTIESVKAGKYIAI